MGGYEASRYLQTSALVLHFEAMKSQARLS